MCRPVIGFDFGNFYAQLGIFLGMDPEKRTGGTYLDLIDPTANIRNGIPTAFFYSSKSNGGKPSFGSQAERGRPVSNIVRYMKRNIRENVTLDGKTYAMGDIITQTAQYCIRQANQQLRAQTQMTTNLVGLAYPNTFEVRDRAYLVECIEKATLEDGTHVKVVGTIKEAAAAALSYAAEYPLTETSSTVMAYDLGAGTFDLTVLKVFPQGARRPDGTVYYYDTCWNDGIGDLGGREFDKLLYDYIVQKEKLKPVGTMADVLMVASESLKRDLTTDDEAYPNLMFAGVFESSPITIQEFNKLAEPVVQRTVAKVRAALNNPNVPKPELILLTGGASQMRIVKQTMEREFPTYRGKIVLHKPSKAISMGAARFATVEGDPDPRVIQQRTTFDLGIRYRESPSDKKGYIKTLIPGETPLPYTTPEHRSATLEDNQRYAKIDIFEANRKDPDKKNVAGDYKYIMGYPYDFGETVPQRTPICHELIIDKDNIMYIRAWRPGRKEETMQVEKCTYTNGK